VIQNANDWSRKAGGDMSDIEDETIQAADNL